MKKNNEMRILFKWSMGKSKMNKKVLLNGFRISEVQSTRNYTKPFVNNIASYYLIQYVIQFKLKI